MFEDHQHQIVQIFALHIQEHWEKEYYIMRIKSEHENTAQVIYCYVWLFILTNVPPLFGIEAYFLDENKMIIFVTQVTVIRGIISSQITIRNHVYHRIF